MQILLFHFCLSSLLFSHIFLPVHSLRLSLGGPSTTSAPASASATWRREDGDPDDLEIRVVDIASKGGPQVLMSVSIPATLSSDSFLVDMTTPGTYRLDGYGTRDSQSGPFVTSNTVTVLPSDSEVATISTSKSTSSHILAVTRTTETSTSTRTTRVSKLATISIPTSVGVSPTNFGATSTSSLFTSTTASISSSEFPIPTQTVLSSDHVDTLESMSATQPFSAPTFTPRPTITTTTVDPKVIIGAVLGAVLALLCLMVTLVICYRSRGYRVRMRGVYGQGQQSLPQKMVPRAFRRRRDSTDSTLPFARRGFNLEKVDLEKDVGETPPLIKALKAPPSAITAYEHELAKSPTDTLARDSVTYVDSSVSRRASLNTDLSVPSQKQKMRISNQSLTRFMGNRPLDGKLTETRVNVDRDLPELPPLQVPPRQDRYRDDEARYTESLALDPPPAYS